MRRSWFKRSGICLLLACTFIINGCEVVQDPKLLMSVPKLPEEQANLMSIINAQLPEGAEKVRPNNSSDGSAVRMADLDGDGKAEAIVFYEVPDSEVRLHGMILKSDGKEWTKVADFEGGGVSLDYVETVDLTRDNRLDLLVGYGSQDQDSLNKGMVVYSFVNNRIEKIFEQPYSQIVINDLDGDSKKELYIVSQHKGKPPVLSQYQYIDQKLTKTAEIQMDVQVNLVYNMVSGLISKDKRGLVLDTVTGSNYYMSVALLCEDGQFYEAFPKEKTIRSQSYPSTDVNNDGIIEFVKNETPQGWDIFREYEIPYFLDYYQWDGKEKLTLVQKQYRDYADRFHFAIPTSWYGRVSIDTKSDRDEYLRFIDYQTNETLAEVKFFSVENWERYKNKWTYLAAYGDEVIGILSKEQLKLNDGSLKLPELEHEGEQQEKKSTK
ncbi:FG-GAP repeat domain-containing protein [Paenibacillus sp. 1001270B_150601_E10]|uniref:FG-GAP repeat domain-containing protein n=1 Tax=Paenibacillus sp. 1001270B_150601_E10 TaxID=2787079 RepID=UPI001E4215CC|nr:VCBS repeat-containing protein [Paenibacillus sp. 1001270B_150601_E10]